MLSVSAQPPEKRRPRDSDGQRQGGQTWSRGRGGGAGSWGNRGMGHVPHGGRTNRMGEGGMNWGMGSGRGGGGVGFRGHGDRIGMIDDMGGRMDGMANEVRVR